MAKLHRTPLPPAATKPSAGRARKGWTDVFERHSARIAAVCVVALLAILCRFVNLGADPPADVSWSQDLLTDPPQYSSYARTAVAHGSWNPLDDDRLVFFRKNITGVFAYIVFLLFGPSIATANFTAIVLNLTAVGFLVWGTARAFGFLAGLGALWVLAVNYLFVSYGRQPFLEVASNACLAVAFWGIIASSKRWWWATVAGFVAGAGTFFGKVTALHAAPVFVLATLILALDEDGMLRGLARFRRPLGYTVGFGLVGLLWYVFAYNQASDQVRAYLTEQARTLYGAPIGLQSLTGFVRQFFSFGVDTKILTWSPIAAIAGLVGICGVVLSSVRRRSQLSWWRQLSPAALLVAGWFICAYLAFSPFNYRPVRYQVVMWFPLAAAFGWMLQRLAATTQLDSKSNIIRPSWWILPVMLGVVAIGLQHFVFAKVMDSTGRGLDTSSHTASIILGLLIAAGSVWFISRPSRRTMNTAPMRASAQAAVAVLLIGVFVDQGRHFIRWWQAPVHTLAQANADLPKVLGDGAIVTGEWSSPLTQLAESPISLTHFFSLEEPKDFFATHPLTHVIVEDKPDGPFFKDFPEVARTAAKVTTYTVRNLRVGVWRVAEVGGNAQAQAYRLSYFERIRSELGRRPMEEFLEDLDARVADSADHYSGWSFAADLFRRSAHPETQGDPITAKAMNAYVRALEFAPDDLALLANAGDLSWAVYRTVGGPAERDRAVGFWQRAVRAAPNNPQILERLRQASRT